MVIRPKLLDLFAGGTKQLTRERDNYAASLTSAERGCARYRRERDEARALAARFTKELQTPHADINETCACGASLRVVMDSIATAQEETMLWREHHRHGPATQPELDVERHDTVLDALVERTDHRDTNPAAELDHRTDRTIPGSNPIGFRGLWRGVA
jgi:hypothetical protein